MEAVCSSKMIVSIYQITRHHIRGDNEIYEPQHYSVSQGSLSFSLGTFSHKTQGLCSPINQSQRSSSNQSRALKVTDEVFQE
jgi:hypothetical protein